MNVLRVAFFSFYLFKRMALLPYIVTTGFLISSFMFVKKYFFFQVHHILNHTSGLHNAMADMIRENPLLMLDWDQCLNRICTTSPETEPGKEQLYHYLSYGWLCGGIIEV